GIVVQFHEPVNADDFPSRKALADYCWRAVSAGVASALAGRPQPIEPTCAVRPLAAPKAVPAAPVAEVAHGWPPDRSAVHQAPRRADDGSRRGAPGRCAGPTRLSPRRGARERGYGDPQHLPHPREGRGESVLRARPAQIPAEAEGAGWRADDPRG